MAMLHLSLIWFEKPEGGRVLGPEQLPAWRLGGGYGAA